MQVPQTKKVEVLNIGYPVLIVELSSVVGHYVKINIQVGQKACPTLKQMRVSRCESELKSKQYCNFRLENFFT